MSCRQEQCLLLHSACSEHEHPLRKSSLASWTLLLTTAASTKRKLLGINALSTVLITLTGAVTLLANAFSWHQWQSLVSACLPCSCVKSSTSGVHHALADEIMFYLQIYCRGEKNVFVLHCPYQIHYTQHWSTVTVPHNISWLSLGK